MEIFQGHEQTFVSCIKIKGINLLPPVINAKRRAELLKYKQQAVKLEKRLENCRELKKNLEELLSLQTLSDRPLSAVTFGDNSHLDALGLTTSRRNSYSKRSIKLSQDVLDVTEYSSDGIKIIDKETSTSRNCTDLSEGHPLYGDSEEFKDSDSLISSADITQPTSNKEHINHSKDQICPVLNLSEIIEGTGSSSLSDTSRNISPISSGRPRLIRSNSYTLEAPSPILLAHLEKYGTVEELKTGEQSSKSHWSSFDNSDIPIFIPLENSEFSSMNTVYNNDLNKAEEEAHAVPRIEVIQTDISVQQITVNGNSETNETVLNNTLQSSDANSRLMEALRTIPEEYSKQIIELIEKQGLERLTKASAFQKAKEEFLYSPRSEGVKQPSEHFDDQYSFSRSSLSPSQSINYSVSRASTVMPTTPCSGLIDLECENDTTNVNEVFEIAEKSSRGMTDKTRKSHEQFFPQSDNEQEWAASVICAHVRGYLTRRLLRTERVQNLIETIKDALLCAIQLHNAENIDESDVELHRRLMNQVSAACYAFHDIFFSLPVSEQMSQIAVDRQRKIDKAKRPISAPTPRRSRSNSSRSSTKSLTPMSRSLTKV